MPVEAQSVKSIFLSALERGTPAEREAHLDAACAGDQALRMRVEALLTAHAESGEFPNFAAMAAAESSTPVHEAETLAPDGSPQTPLLDFLAPPREPGHLGRLEHYEVHSLVGQGGMGVVFKAFDETLDRIVAVKVLAPQYAANATARRRFVREAKAIAAVVHEHVVTVHAVEETGPIPYLVMQFIQGVSLQERLERGGPLDVKAILRIGMQAARGLGAAHAQGIVHRDIKPANILLENGVERVKITDFGLARAVDDASITQSGVIAGTPMFMSPEQAHSQPVDPRSDLFSLGSVLYTLCTGHPPFRADSTPAVLMRVVEDVPRPVREVNPDIPDWLEAIIAKLHAKKPEERFQSAKEVAELLEQHLAHLQQPHLSPRPAPVTIPTHSRPQPAAPPEKPGTMPRFKTLLSWGLLIFFVLLFAVPVINLVERSHTYPAILRAASLVVALGGLISAIVQSVRMKRLRLATARSAAPITVEATEDIPDVLPATPRRSPWRRVILIGLGYALLVFVLFGLLASYSDAGWWSTPWIEFISAPAFLVLGALHFRRRPRWLAAVPVLFALLFVGLGFVLWPYATGRTFARLVREGRFEEANRMLVNSEPWTYANGKLTIRDTPGASVDLDARDFPLMSYDGSWDHFIGQKDETANIFTLTSHRVNSCFCNITVTAHYGTVICESIHRYVADSNNVAQVLSPFHWAERRGDAGPPATEPRSGPIDLLALASSDPEKLNGGKGTWRKEKGKLICERGAMASKAWIALPSAPAEYDLGAVLERTEGDLAILFGMKAKDKLFHVGLDMAEPVDDPARWSGMDRINGKTVPDSSNPTRTRGPHLTNGKKHTLRCQVRATGVTATLDNKPLFRYQEGFDKIRGSNNTPADAFFVFAYGQTRYIVHQLTLTPYSPPPAADRDG